MHTQRALFARDPRRFGRARVFALAAPVGSEWGLSDDLQTFVATFVAGFVFVSILIG